MDNVTARKIAEIQEALLQDVQYGRLLEEYQLHDCRFVQMLGLLPADQRCVLEDYLGVCVELHLKMLEYACR